MTTADFVALRRAGWMVSPLVEGRLRAGAARVSVLGIDPVTRLGLAPGGSAGPGAEGDLGAFITPPGLGYAAPDTAATLAEADLGGLRIVINEDAPANTLIVDRADKYGLSQLHQLRGRVGRRRHPTLKQPCGHARQHRDLRLCAHGPI